MKTNKPPSNMSNQSQSDEELIRRLREQKEKNAQRVREHIVNLYVSDPEIKRKMRVLAKAEGRSVSNWFTHHFGSHIETQIARKEAALHGSTESPQEQSAAAHSASS